MKITIEIPDKTVCAFFDYVYYTNTGMSMASKQIGTDDIHSREVIVCDTDHKNEKGGGFEK